MLEQRIERSLRERGRSFAKRVGQLDHEHGVTLRIREQLRESWRGLRVIIGQRGRELGGVGRLQRPQLDRTNVVATPRGLRISA